MCSAELLPELVQKCAKCEPTAENEMRRDGNDGENDEIIVYKWTAGQWSEVRQYNIDQDHDFDHDHTHDYDQIHKHEKEIDHK